MLLAAHPSTALGRDQGVVVGMLTSFILGLAVVLHVISGNNLHKVPVFNDLDRNAMWQGGATAEEPRRRHRLHGGGVLLRHPVGMRRLPAGSHLSRLHHVM
jgi:hypothetical protein